MRITKYLGQMPLNNRSLPKYMKMMMIEKGRKEERKQGSKEARKEGRKE